MDVPLSADEERELVNWLADEINAALDARATVIQQGGDLDYWHWLYEQGRKASSAKPWASAADLGSYIPTEKVDAMRARIVKTVFTEPVWVVEGWGRDAQRAPIVEEFHQWKTEEERLQTILGKAFHLALVEGTGVLECYERTERRLVRKQETVVPQASPDGGLVFDVKGQPEPARQPDGQLLPATDEQQPQMDLVTEQTVMRRGPGYRVLSLRDFLFLPGHAADVDGLWGYAKRFYRRVPELQQREKDGVYRHVEALDDADERTQTESQRAAGQDVAVQRGPTAEKELWEVLFLSDLDGKGERWYVATLSVSRRVLLRLQHDDLGRPRFFAFTPFPRADSVYGYSLVGHKLITTSEEHTALRNMVADRSALATNAPIKRVQGALWNPDTQPWGPRAVIDVRDVREIEPMQVPDVPPSAIERERAIITAAERVSGLNDVALGTLPQQDRTLGEVQLVTEQSFVRMEEAIHYIQEQLEDLWQVRNELWIRALQQGEGEPAPTRMVQSLESHGVVLPDGAVTAAMLRGAFRGKPRGSVETADLLRLRADFNGFLQSLPPLIALFPQLGLYLGQPQAARALLEHALRVYRVPDRQAFLGPPPETMGQFPPPLLPGLPGMAGVGPMGSPSPGGPSMSGQPGAQTPPLAGATPAGPPTLGGNGGMDPLLSQILASMSTSRPMG